MSNRCHLRFSSVAPLEQGSKLEELVRGIRVRKGLKVCDSQARVWKTSTDGLHASARYPCARYLLRQALGAREREECAGLCSCSVLFTSCCVAVAFDLRLVLSAKSRQFTVSCSERCGGKDEVAADSTRGRCGNGNRLLRYLVIRRLGPGREDVCIRAPSVVHKAYIPQVSRKDGVGRHSP